MIELAEQWLIDGAPLDRQIAAVFDRCFAGDYRTQLCGGAEEPLYVPAGSQGELHTVWYREDFARSALHEAAHWCIAGDARRQLDDYGYWYEPDGRNEVQQREFERVESRPQALEWFFAMAAGLPFRVSIDNLSGGDIDDFPFAWPYGSGRIATRPKGCPRGRSVFGGRWLWRFVSRWRSIPAVCC